jgi:hypothetical protein
MTVNIIGRCAVDMVSHSLPPKMDRSSDRWPFFLAMDSTALTQGALSRQARVAAAWQARRL